MVELLLTEMNSCGGHDGDCSFGHVKLEVPLDMLVATSSSSWSYESRVQKRGPGWR